MYLPSFTSVVLYIFTPFYSCSSSHRAGSAEFDSRTDVILPTDEYLDLKVPALEAGVVRESCYPVSVKAYYPHTHTHTHTHTYTHTQASKG